MRATRGLTLLFACNDGLTTISKLIRGSRNKDFTILKVAFILIINLELPNRQLE